MKEKPKRFVTHSDSPASDEVRKLCTNTLQPAKTPKTATKLKLSTPKTPSTDSASKKKSGSSTKANKTKASAAPRMSRPSRPSLATGSDEESVATPKALTPQEAKQKKEKEG